MINTMPYSLAKPISVYVSHEWQKDDIGTLPVRRDERWRSLRDLNKNVAEEVKTRNRKRPGHHKLNINIQRLRARHGQFILTSLCQRIQRADVLVMDLGSDQEDLYNKNVLIELGMAIGMGKLQSQDLFILKPDHLTIPSDLKGLLYTDYKSSPKEKIEVIDKLGFRAALKSTLTYIATQREMIGEPIENTVDVEGDSE
jgi:hypothetical protein